MSRRWRREGSGKSGGYGVEKGQRAINSENGRK